MKEEVPTVLTLRVHRVIGHGSITDTTSIDLVCETLIWFHAHYVLGADFHGSHTQKKKILRST